MPAAKHNFTVVEIKAGLMVLASVFVLVLFIAVTSGLRPARETSTFYASFTDTGGLNKGATVRFGGMKVGRVTDITLDPMDSGRILVKAQVEKNTPVHEDSEAFIGQTSLTAEKHLEITTGTKAAKCVLNGAEIPTRQGSLFDQAGALADRVQKLLADVQTILGVDAAQQKEAKGEGKMTTVADIATTVNDAMKKGSGLVEDVRDVIKDNRETVASVIERLKSIEDAAQKLMGDVQGVISENRADIRASVEGVRSIVDQANDVMGRVGEVSGQLDQLADSVQSILNNADALSADAHDFLDANRPAIEDTLNDLRDTVRRLKDFVQTLRDQPNAAVFGKSPEGRR